VDIFAVEAQADSSPWNRHFIDWYLSQGSGEGTAWTQRPGETARSTVVVCNVVGNVGVRLTTLTKAQWTT